MAFLAHRICIVIGAAHGGIGFAFAEEAGLKYDMRVALCDVDEERCLQRVRELRERGVQHCCGLAVDISKPEQVAHLATRARELLQCPDVAIVMNAAALFAEDANALDPSLDLWRSAVEINVLGPVYVNKMALAAFRDNPIVEASMGQKPCHLLQVSSLSAFTGGTGEPYASTKLALVSLMENLHKSLTTSASAAHNAPVSLHLVLPGVVKTQFALSSHRAKKRFGVPIVQGNAVAPTSAQALELKEMMNMGLTPAQVATRIFASLLANEFYIVVDNEPISIDLASVFAKRTAAILNRTPPPQFETQVPILLEARRRAKETSSSSRL